MLWICYFILNYSLKTWSALKANIWFWSCPATVAYFPFPVRSFLELIVPVCPASPWFFISCPSTGWSSIPRCEVHLYQRWGNSRSTLRCLEPIPLHLTESPRHRISAKNNNWRRGGWYTLLFHHLLAKGIVYMCLLFRVNFSKSNGEIQNYMTAKFSFAFHWLLLISKY